MLIHSTRSSGGGGIKPQKGMWEYLKTILQCKKKNKKNPPNFVIQSELHSLYMLRNMEKKKPKGNLL